MAPWLFIVPGIYEGPGAFAPLVQSLRAAGYENIHTTQLVSTGCDINNKPLPTMGDDIAAIARDLTEVVDKAGSDGVVTLLHSAAGFLGSAAMKGLTAPARTAAGVRLPPGSGVRQIIFLAAGVMPEGAKHTPQPFMVFDVCICACHPRDGQDGLGERSGWLTWRGGRAGERGHPAVPRPTGQLVPRPPAGRSRALGCDDPASAGQELGPGRSLLWLEGGAQCLYPCRAGQDAASVCAGEVCRICWVQGPHQGRCRTHAAAEQDGRGCQDHSFCPR